MSNIITVTFSGQTEAYAAGSLWQYDYGQILQIAGLELPEAYQVHFSNTPVCGSAKTAIGGSAGVQIPDQYLQSGEPVYAFVFLHAGENDGETEYKITIPVLRRPQPSDEEPTPAEQSAIDQAIAALNVAVQKTADAAVLAESYAVGGTGTRPGEDADNAKYYAQAAEQAAGSAGYMFFYIDGNGHLIYQRTTNTLVDFYLQGGHLYVEANG